MTQTAYLSKTYYALALDPIHVGTGGYRLGRVELSIIREAGTDLPKVPGTSLSGVARAYLAMQTPGKYPRCAGLGQEQQDASGMVIRQGHCASYDCPVCVTFGFSQPDRSFAGLAHFTDLSILFFPVATMKGPVWVTSPGQLERTGRASTLTLAEKTALEQHKALMPAALGPKINLGWLLLEEGGERPELGLDPSIPEEVRSRTLLISDRLFVQVVNRNLEVRTSVAIDPRTGAAEEPALFTYEAIPRAAGFCFEVICQNPSHFRINGQAPALPDVQAVQAEVEKGFRYLSALGIGGMNTRGMGRLKVLNLGGEQA